MLRYTVMAYIVMAYISMAYIVMDRPTPFSGRLLTWPDFNRDYIFLLNYKHVLFSITSMFILNNEHAYSQ